MPASLQGPARLTPFTAGALYACGGATSGPDVSFTRFILRALKAL